MRARHFEPNVTCDIEICFVKHERMWRVRVFCSHPPVGCMHIAISCKRSDYNNKQSCRNSTLSFLMSEHPKQVSLFFEAAHCMSSESSWQSLIYELHGCSFHCHHEVLEEDDECHLLYWWRGIGSGRSSPDSRWRRCNVCKCFSEVWSASIFASSKFGPWVSSSDWTQRF